MRYPSSLLIVAPPKKAKPVLRFTVLPSSSVSTKLLSRESFVHRVNMPMASSQEIRCHSVPPGARYIGYCGRRSLTASCTVDAPFGHSVPPLTGLSGSPSM